MIFEDEMREILTRLEMPASTASKALKKDPHLITVELFNAKKNGTPISQKMCKTMIKKFGREKFVEVVGTDVVELCMKKYFFSRSQVNQFLKKTKLSTTKVSFMLGYYSKTFYMKLFHCGGIDLQTTFELVLYYPDEMLSLLSAVQFNRLMRFLGENQKSEFSQIHVNTKIAA